MKKSSTPNNGFLRRSPNPIEPLSEYTPERRTRFQMSKQNNNKGINWLNDIEEHDYPAAESYLLLVYSAPEVTKIIARLRSTEIVQFKAKDIFRASQLSFLGISNSHVEKDREKIKSGTPLSPLLLLRDEKNGKVVIADGYHRLCAIYGFDEDASIRCKIV